MSLFAVGIVTAGLVALILLMRVRARFVRQAGEIAEANRRFQVTFDQAAVGITHLDTNGRWLRVNDRFCEITGYSREELLALPFQDITHPDDVAGDLAKIGSLIAGESDHMSIEKRYIRKNGSIAWTNVTRSIVRDGHGAPEFFVSVIEDISARMHAEERLRQLQNEFAHLARVNELGEMAAAIAHEINQPLAAIVNYLNSGLFLAERGHSEENFGHLAQDMARASEQALRAGEIVRRLRAFISHSTGERTPENIERLVDAAVELALIDAKYAGIKVEKRLATDGLEVEVDSIQIHQVLVNLLRNAVDALTINPPGQERLITIDAIEDGDSFVAITIADTGPGIAPEVYERLFQPFVTSKLNGMGMGLSVCHRLVEAHGGTISAESRPGSGTSFTFRLPRFQKN